MLGVRNRTKYAAGWHALKVLLKGVAAHTRQELMSSNFGTPFGVPQSVPPSRPASSAISAPSAIELFCLRMARRLVANAWDIPLASH